MKFLIIVVILAIVVAVAWLAVLLVRMAFASRKAKPARWTVVPRSGIRDGRTVESMLYLCKPGEEEFLFWPTKHNKMWDLDRAMMEAEIHAADMNRMDKELTR